MRDGPFHVFLGFPYSFANTCGFLDPWVCQSFSKPSISVSFLIFLLRFLATSGLSPQGVGMSKFADDFFGPTHRDGASHCESSESAK